MSQVEEITSRSIKKINSYNRGQSFSFLKVDPGSLIINFTQKISSQSETLSMLEIILRNFIKEIQNLLESVENYKNSLSYLSSYTSKKDYLTVLLNSSILDTNEIKELKFNIVS